MHLHPWVFVIICSLGIEVADSLNRLYAGVDFEVDGHMTTIRAMVTQFRGDWKWHRVSGLQLISLASHGWNLNN